MNSFIHWLTVRLRHQLLVVAALCVVASGCGGPANKYDSLVSGTVTIEGELAPSGTITFHPVAKDGKIAVGRIYPDGSFSLRTGQGDLRESDGGTVVPGEYIVTVAVTGPAPPPTATTPQGGPPSSGPLLIDPRYISRETSDLRYTIVPGDNVLAIDLERPSPEAEEVDTTDDAVGESDPSAAGATVDQATTEPTADQAPVEGATP